jgi:hypothetical protein
MLSPHFPPDSTAATHRVRLLAPHMAEHGWEPVVVTIEPDGYEGRLDPGLATLVPSSVRVVRCRAWSPRWTRRLGIGDLGLRALPSALRTCVSLMRRERVDAVFITTYPIYTAVLGPILKRMFSVPFVIDLQDPWVGAWGRLAGGGANGAPDVKSRITRRVAAGLEGPVLRAADAIVAVSAGTYEEIFARRPELRTKACAAIPIGGDEADFAIVAANGRSNAFFDRRDGFVHICSVGTILPMGMDTVRAVLTAAADLRRRHPDAGSRLRLHFFGTSNERSEKPAGRVEPIAREIGVADLITEHPARVDYLDAVRLQLDADALLLMGSREAHYTASKLYPALLARRPLLALYHESSSVVGILRRYTRAPTIRLVTFDDEHPAMTQVEVVAKALEALIASPAYTASDIDPRVFTEHSARVLAGHLADVLTKVA